MSTQKTYYYLFVKPYNCPDGKGEMQGKYIAATGEWEDVTDWMFLTYPGATVETSTDFHLVQGRHLHSRVEVAPVVSEHYFFFSDSYMCPSRAVDMEGRYVLVHGRKRDAFQWVRGTYPKSKWSYYSNLSDFNSTTLHLGMDLTIEQDPLPVPEPSRYEHYFFFKGNYTCPFFGDDLYSKNITVSGDRMEAMARIRKDFPGAEWEIISDGKVVGASEHYARIELPYEIMKFIREDENGRHYKCSDGEETLLPSDKWLNSDEDETVSNDDTPDNAIFNKDLINDRLEYLKENPELIQEVNRPEKDEVTEHVFLFSTTLEYICPFSGNVSGKYIVISGAEYKYAASWMRENYPASTWFVFDSEDELDDSHEAHLKVVLNLENNPWATVYYPNGVNHTEWYEYKSRVDSPKDYIPGSDKHDGEHILDEVDPSGNRKMWIDKEEERVSDQLDEAYLGAMHSDTIPHPSKISFVFTKHYDCPFSGIDLINKVVVVHSSEGSEALEWMSLNYPNNLVMAFVGESHESYGSPVELHATVYLRENEQFMELPNEQTMSVLSREKSFIEVWGDSKEFYDSIRGQLKEDLGKPEGIVIHRVNEVSKMSGLTPLEPKPSSLIPTIEEAYLKAMSEVMYRYSVPDEPNSSNSFSLINTLGELGELENKLNQENLQKLWEQSKETTTAMPDLDVKESIKDDKVPDKAIWLDLEEYEAIDLWYRGEGPYIHSSEREEQSRRVIQDNRIAEEVKPKRTAYQRLLDFFGIAGSEVDEKSKVEQEHVNTIKMLEDELVADSERPFVSDKASVRNEETRFSEWMSEQKDKTSVKFRLEYLKRTGHSYLDFSQEEEKPKTTPLTRQDLVKLYEYALEQEGRVKITFQEFVYWISKNDDGDGL